MGKQAHYPFLNDPSRAVFTLFALFDFHLLVIYLIFAAQF